MTSILELSPMLDLRGLSVGRFGLEGALEETAQVEHSGRSSPGWPLADNGVRRRYQEARRQKLAQSPSARIRVLPSEIADPNSGETREA